MDKFSNSRYVKLFRLYSFPYVQFPSFQLIITQNQQQPQQQQQILTAPPGLHEVPEATRVSNKQLLQTKENLEQHQQQQQQQQQIIANNQQHQSMIANQNMFSVGMAGQTDGSAGSFDISQK